MTEDHLLMEGAKSIQLFQDHLLHLEFRLPYKPAARGQGRGNSGLYLQGRYEVQMLDSFGLEGKSNECGGVYGIAPPVKTCVSLSRLANLRRRIPGRRIQRWPKGKERMDDRAAQWRGHSRSFGFAKENDRLSSQGRAGTWFRLLAKSWKSGPVSKHLGQTSMSNQVLLKLWAVLCLLFISCGDDAESVAKRDLSKASPSDSSDGSLRVQREQATKLRMSGNFEL